MNETKNRSRSVQNTLKTMQKSWWGKDQTWIKKRELKLTECEDESTANKTDNFYVKKERQPRKVPNGHRAISNMPMSRPNNI